MFDDFITQIQSDEIASMICWEEIFNEEREVRQKNWKLIFNFSVEVLVQRTKKVKVPISENLSTLIDNMIDVLK